MHTSMSKLIKMSQPIYANVYRSEKHTNKTQKGSDCEKRRWTRVARGCLGLLCFHLLIGVIALSAILIISQTDCKQAKDQLANITTLTEERNQLLRTITERSSQINELLKSDGWIYFQSSLYYMWNETKTWEASSRSCKESGADLIIINSEQEQDFLMNITRNEEFWIGLNDSEVEGTWKWVNGDTTTTMFWATNEPNGGHNENCAVTHINRHPDLIGWLDVSCNDQYKWICEKKLLTMP
ncbi:hypothetical protein DNTS_006475 [Danionella cerebrum]|uniref:C-type lectin domain-containing protein n=1 Tax=Danionella cerebrum TaxID=2873325 RepID=A0A553QQJ6_9TELE|nr:hypothetical protein DNTS_006475 [Danionella translucida]